MALKTLFCLQLLSVGILMFKQNDFKLTFERVEVVRYDKFYISHLTTHNFKYNRTTAVVNATLGIKQYMGHDAKIEVQAYRWASNEYRLFPVRFMFDFCDYASKNEFGIGDIYKCGNFTKCPVKKGIYHMCNWSLNGSKFPPHIPAGSYMLDLKFFYHNVEIAFIQPSASVKYPEVPGFSIL